LLPLNPAPSGFSPVSKKNMKIRIYKTIIMPVVLLKLVPDMKGRTQAEGV
jgi:hypothetical protein